MGVSGDSYKKPSYIAQRFRTLPKTRLPELQFCRKHYRLGRASVNNRQLAPKDNALCEITRNDGHRTVQGHSRSTILALIERAYDIRLPIAK